MTEDTFIFGSKGAYGMWSPDVPKKIKNAIKKLYRILDRIPGYNDLPMLSRHSFQYLKKWVGKYHPQHKARLILDFLCWE